MKEDKKKILTAAAFLIAAGLVFGMTRSRSGIQKLDESGAVVMSGSLDADGNISWEKNGSAKSDGLPQGDSGSSTEKQEIQEPFRDENGSVQGESTVETQEYVENSEKSGVYVYICGEVQPQVCMSFRRTAGSTRQWMPPGDLRRTRRGRV